MEIYAKTPYWELVVVPHYNPDTGKYDGEWWMTLVDIKYVIYGKLIIVPAGFITNFGSVPKWARGIVDTSDESVLAFVIHDYLYGKDSEYKFTKKKVDYVLYSVALKSGQDYTETLLVYFAVCWFGRKAFKKKPARFGKIEETLIDKICKDNNYYPDNPNKKELGIKEI